MCPVQCNSRVCKVLHEMLGVGLFVLKNSSLNVHETDRTGVDHLPHAEEDQGCRDSTRSCCKQKL